MGIDLRKFFQATNPSKTLVIENAEDEKYYIDFSSVRGGKIIQELRDNITFFCRIDLLVFCLRDILAVVSLLNC